MWKQVGPTDVFYNFRAVWGRGSGDVFVGGGAGLLHSRDHGKTWKQVSGIGTADIYAITGDDKVVLVAGDTGEKRSIPHAPGTAPEVVVANHGAIFRSEDDGATFAEQRPHAGVVLGLATAGADTIAVTCQKAAVEQGSASVGKKLNNFAAFLVSSDRGRTWKPDRLPSLTVTQEMLWATNDALQSGSTGNLCGLHGIAAVDGGVCGFGPGGALYLKTSKTGHRWSHIAGPSGDRLNALWSDGGSTLYAGLYKGLMRSTDGGKTWKMVDDRFAILGLWGSSPTDIYAVGAATRFKDGSKPQGPPVVLHSTDGTTWHEEQSDAVGPLTAVWGAGPGEVYAVGASGALLKRQ